MITTKPDKKEPDFDQISVKIHCVLFMWNFVYFSLGMDFVIINKNFWCLHKDQVKNPFHF